MAAAMVANIRASTASVLARQPTDLEGVDRVEGEPGLQEGILEVAVEGSGGFVGDPVDLGVDPGDQLPESGRIVRESGRSPLEPGVGVELVLGDVDPDGVKDAHLPFSCACHASLDAHVSIRDVGKDGGDHTPVRPLAAKRPAV